MQLNAGNSIINVGLPFSFSLDKIYYLSIIVFTLLFLAEVFAKVYFCMMSLFSFRLRSRPFRGTFGFIHVSHLYLFSL